MKYQILTTLVVVFAVSIIEAEETIPPEKRFPFYKTVSVDASAIEFKDNIWKPRQETLSNVGFDWMTRHFDRSGGFAAYRANPTGYRARLVGGGEPIKMIEAAAEAIRLRKITDLDAYMQTWSDVYIERQADDGFLTFPALGRRKDRWENLRWSHVFYMHGHYLEAAIAMFQADGSRKMLDSARRSMLLIDETFGPDKKHGAPGHEEIELALMRYYGLTGEKRWLDLCRFFIEQRSDHRTREPFGEYAQDHKPVKDQRHVVGHAVRAGFLFAGVADVVGAIGDSALREATVAVWDDMVKRHQYITGGTGVYLANNEGYGPPYLLPPDDAYAESCASVANVLWASRLFRLQPHGKYYDNIETILYNAFLDSLSLSGDRFYYTNHVQSEVPNPRDEWHSCPCCPPNITKLIGNVGQYFYSTDDDGIRINLYGDSVAIIPFASGNVVLEQRGGYPWNGDLQFALQETPEQPFSLRFRIPDGNGPRQCRVNGVDVMSEAKVVDGYLDIRRDWKKGDTVRLELPMEVHRVTMPKEFKEYRGLVAFKRGPVVYCAEEIDVGKKLFTVVVSEDTVWKAEYRNDFLGGCTVLKGTGKRWTGKKFDDIPMTLVPYHLQSNRTPGEMRIWFATTKEALPESRVLTSFNSRGAGLNALRDGEFGLKDKFAVKRFTWWPEKGKTGWVQYEYAFPKQMQQSRISWFDDTPGGGCKLPESWKIVYRNDKSDWAPVDVVGEPEKPQVGKIMTVRFKPVEAVSIRLEIKMYESFSAGVLEWDAD